MKLFEDFNVKKKNKVSAAELLFHACYFRTFQKKKSWMRRIHIQNPGNALLWTHLTPPCHLHTRNSITNMANMEGFFFLPNVWL